MILDGVIQGLLLVLAWPAIGYLVAGVFIGLYFGAVPGLSGLVGMAILLPFTFGLDPVAGFAFLLGMYAVTTTSDTVASVLLGVPGTAGSQATILDGYPMAQKGEAARAFGAAFTVSALGGILGALVLALSIPIVRPLILSFASPEFFMLGLLGLTMVGALSGDSLARGLAAAAMGVLISTIGYAPQTGSPRFDVGAVYLLEGFTLIPVALGLFAIPELIFLAIRDTSIANIPESETTSGLMTGVRDAFRHWWLALRCTVIGVYIGMLPGLGASIVDWAAYGHAVQSTPDKTQFGKGDVRGVIAPESANNAMKGGALVPTIAFGIPGSASMAILLGAFLIHGLTPGSAMLTRNVHITFSMVWTLVIANILGAVLLMIWSRQLARLTFVRGNLIVPAIMLFVLMGAWMANSTMGDWYTVLGFGTFGLLMRFTGWPRAPIVLGLILGPIMENGLYITLQSYGLDWFLRPVSAIILVLIVVTVLLTTQGYFGRRKRIARGEQQAVFIDFADDEQGIRAVSLPFAAGNFLIVAWAVWVARDWTYAASLIPLASGVPALVLLFIIIVQEFLILRKEAAKTGRTAGAVYFDALRPGKQARGIWVMYLWFAGIIIATMIAGQLVALPLFVLAYLLWMAKTRLRFALIYAGLAFTLLYFMFDRIIHIVWHPALLIF